MRSGIICAAICLSMAAFGQATQTTVTEYRTITTTFYNNGSDDAKPTNIHDHDNGDLTDPAPEPTEKDKPTPPQAPKGDPRPPVDEGPRGPEPPKENPRPPTDGEPRGPQPPHDDVRPPPDGKPRGPEVRPPPNGDPRGPEVRPPPNGDPRGPEVRPPPNGDPRVPQPPQNGNRPPPPPPPANNIGDKPVAPEPSKSGERSPQESLKNGKSQSLIHTATPPLNNKVKPTSASASASGVNSNVADDFTFSPITLAPESTQSIRPTTLRELTASNGATQASSSTESHAVGAKYTLSFATVTGMTMMCFLASTLVQL